MNVRFLKSPFCRHGYGCGTLLAQTRVVEEMMVTPMRIGVVGPGLIWKHAHRPAIEKLGDAVEVAAFSASSEKTRQEVADEYPDKPFFFDYQELVQQPDLDAVLILTPIALNAPVALAALRANKTVLLEKPMARTLSEAEELVDEARKRDLNLWILEQDGYRTVWQQVRALLDAGEIGRVVSFERVWHRFFLPETSGDGSAGTAWRQEPDFILGTLYDGGHHAIAALSTLFGSPRSVYATSVSLRPGYGESDHETMILDYGQDLHGYFSHATYLGGARNYFIIRGTDGLLDVGREQLVVEQNDGTQRFIPLERSGAHDTMWRAVLQAYRDGVQPAYTPECGLRELAILHGIYMSIQQEKRIDIPYPASMAMG
jgi:predicted dehydrogenase